LGELKGGGKRGEDGFWAGIILTTKGEDGFVAACDESLLLRKRRKGVSGRLVWRGGPGEGGGMNINPP